MSETDTAALRAKYRLKGNPKIGLTGATIGFFIGFAAVALFGTTAKKLDTILDLSPLMLGVLVAIPSLSGSLLRIPFGAWTDKIGARIPILTLLVVSIIGMTGLTVLFYTSYPKGMGPSDLPLLLALGTLSGAGIATFSPGVNLTSYWSRKNTQGRDLGIYGGFGNLAPGIFTLIIPTALLEVGLPGAYATWLVLLVIGTVIFALVARNSYWFQLRSAGVPEGEAKDVAQRMGQELFPSGQFVDSLRTSFRNPRTWALVLLYFTSFGGFLALTSWLPTFWAASYLGTSKAEVFTAALMTAFGFALLSPLTRVGGGLLSDRQGGEKVALAGFSVMFVGGVLVTAMPGEWTSLAGIVLMGAGMGLANAAVFRLVPKYVPEAVGGASGWVGGVGATGGFLIPPILGEYVAVYGKSGYTLGFSLFVVLSVVSIVVAYLLMIHPHVEREATPSTMPRPAERTETNAGAGAPQGS